MKIIASNGNDCIIIIYFSSWNVHSKLKKKKNRPFIWCCWRPIWYAEYCFHMHLYHLIFQNFLDHWLDRDAWGIFYLFDTQCIYSMRIIQEKSDQYSFCSFFIYTLDELSILFIMKFFFSIVWNDKVKFNFPFEQCYLCSEEYNPPENHLWSGT